MGGHVQDSSNISLYEPRIEYIKHLLESILSVVDLEKDGQRVEVNGFRLKNLSDWTVPSACDPMEILAHAASRCRCDCIFCYNKGNPPSVALHNLKRSAQEEYEEILTRLKYFRPESGLSLFPSAGNVYDALTHPKIFDILALLRQKTSHVFRITTDGAVLTPEFIQRLSEFQPLYIYLSLNSASPLRRSTLMNDRNPQVAIDAVPLLKESQIPYALVVVPWPLDSMDELLKDVAETTRYADNCDAHIVALQLPGYTTHFSTEKLFDLEDLWTRVVSLARDLRHEVSVPIVAMPTLYEENLFEKRKNVPKIIGIVKRSPAASSALAVGDEIVEINGLPVSSRPMARDLLAAAARSGTGQVQLRVRRQGRQLVTVVDQGEHAYPYHEGDEHLGIVMMGAGFRQSHVEKWRDIIDAHGSRQVLFLSSRLVKPLFQQAIIDSHLFDDRDLKLQIEVPTNRFFGGNIFMGDLLVVQDFIDCIQEYLDRGNPRPDLIVIPSSPFNIGQWRRDLTGRPYLDIERHVRIPVELLECSTVFD